MASLPSLKPGPGSAGETACAPARPHAEGTFEDTITTSDGLTREYTLHIPPSYTGADATPLAIQINPDGSSSAMGGYIIVGPQKTERPEGLDLPEVYRWNFAQLSVMADDVAFIEELLDALESQLCVDPIRVYALGASIGGLMSVRLACSLSERIAAIAVDSGVYFPPLAPELNPDERCPDTRPVPIVALHGDADATIPFNGGTSFGATFRDIDDEIMPLWAAHNRCDSVPSEERVTDTVRLVRYQGCDHGATVELYIVEGGGHDGLGFHYDTQAFFEAHSLILELGDVGCDGVVNSIDAALILQFDAGLIDSLVCPENADVSEDGNINAIDATIILQLDAGLIDSL